MKNAELFVNTPNSERILNQGVAEVSERKDEAYDRILRYELETFICEGQYAKGLDKIFSHYLNTLGGGKAAQRNIWISGFFGSGKTHLAKMLRVLWTDHTFKDNSTARGIVHLTDDIRAHLKELSAAADRNAAGLFAASGKMGGGGTASVRLAVLGIICKAAGFPSQYAQVKLMLWLREHGKLESVVGSLKQAGKDFTAELENMYVSPVLASAIRTAFDGDYKDDADVREAIRANFKQLADIDDNEFVTLIEKIVSRDGKFPLTLLVLDELQQFIGIDADRAYNVQLVAESCANNFGGNLLIVGTGQSALSDTPNLSRLLGRFPEKVQLDENDVERVIRKIILAKKPSLEPGLKSELERRHGEIARHLEASNFAHTGKDDADLASDYPLLPTRRRFWEHVLRTIDPSGTTAQMRNQLRVVNEAVVSVQDKAVGCIVGGDFVFDQNAETLVASQMLDRETYTRILELSGSGNPDDILMGRILKLVFLINKLPTEGGSDTKLRATEHVLADLLIENLDEDSTGMRHRIPELLGLLVQRHALMDLEGDHGKEYRLQTGESAEWYEEYRKQESFLRASAGTVGIKRDVYLRSHLDKETKGLSFIHGLVKEPRRPEFRYEQAIPMDYKKKLYVWVRDGSQVSEAGAAGDARALDKESPAIILYLPDEKSNELFNAIVTAEAAQATINVRGQPGTPAGVEARKSIESRLSGAAHGIDRCLVSMVEGARIWLAGGSEMLSGIGMRSLLEEALKAAVGRLYPKFKEADSGAWAEVVRIAKTGNGEALKQLGHNGDPAEYPVCITVLGVIGQEKTGKEIRDELGEAPYGWSRDAIDGALLVLLASGRLLASEAGNHTVTYSAQTMDRSKIGLCRFKHENRPLSPTDRLLLRGLYQSAGVPCKSGEELQGSNDYLTALRTLADKAGGAPPLPPVPSAPLLLELEGLLGNDRLFRIIEKQAELKEFQELWKTTARAIEQRRNSWNILQGLLDKSLEIVNLSPVRDDRDAILASRSLASAVDPVELLLHAAADELRQAINEKVKAYQDQYAHLHAVLESDPVWQRLRPEQRVMLLAKANVQTPAVPDLSSPDAVLASLSERPLDAWLALIDALAGRFQLLREAALKLLEPEVVHLNLPKRVIKTEAELEAWLAEVRARVKEQLGKAPVSL